MAALGGMVIPALFFLALNFETSHISGWGIPMASDIAFAIGLLELIGRRAPLSENFSFPVFLFLILFQHMETILIFYAFPFPQRGW